MLESCRGVRESDRKEHHKQKLINNNKKIYSDFHRDSTAVQCSTLKKCVLNFKVVHVKGQWMMK